MSKLTGTFSIPELGIDNVAVRGDSSEELLGVISIIVEETESARLKEQDDKLNYDTGGK